MWSGRLPDGAARYDGPAHGVDRPAAIAVDDPGNIYVTGVSDNSFTSGDTSYATVKYDPNGTQLGADALQRRRGRELPHCHQSGRLGS